MVHNVEQRTTCGNVVSPRLHELIQSSSPGFLLSVTTKISWTSHQLLEESLRRKNSFFIRGNWERLKYAQFYWCCLLWKYRASMSNQDGLIGIPNFFFNPLEPCKIQVLICILLLCPHHCGIYNFLRWVDALICSSSSLWL
jgi:hypothetical protein